MGTGFPGTPGRNNDAQLRVSSADRQRAAQALEDLFAMGYLDTGEFEHRCGIAYRAATRGELNELFDDIPAGALAGSSALVPTPSPAEITVGDRTMSVYEAALLGRRRKLAVMIITLIAATAGTYASHNGLPYIAVPVMFVLIYLLNVGPSWWYVRPPGFIESVTTRINEIGRPNTHWEYDRRLYRGKKF